jgi:hypothetical protein
MPTFTAMVTVAPIVRWLCVGESGERGWTANAPSQPMLALGGGIRKWKVRPAKVGYAVENTGFEAAKVLPNAAKFAGGFRGVLQA